MHGGLPGLEQRITDSFRPSVPRIQQLGRWVADRLTEACGGEPPFGSSETLLSAPVVARPLNRLARLPLAGTFPLDEGLEERIAEAGRQPHPDFN
jgi:hypothetical protein